LSPSAHRRQEDDDRNEVRRLDRGRHQRAEQRRDEGGVQRHVEPRPGRPAEERQARKRRQLHRARTKEVEERRERRPEVEAERAAHASESESLEEAAPQEGLLERDPLEPPCADSPRAPEAGREAHEERPPEDEERQLDGVEEIRGERQADPLQHELLAAQADQLGEILRRQRGGSSRRCSLGVLTVAERR
jgi:hypothetical protein